MTETATNLKLSDFKAIIFDVYGTLIEWGKGFTKYPNTSFSDTEIWDMYTTIEHEVEVENPTMRMDMILLEVWDRIKNKLDKLENVQGSRSEEDEIHRREFGDVVKTYEVFPDTAEALRRLSNHYKLTILSNINHDGIANSHAKMAEESVLLDGVLDAYNYPNPNPHGDFWFPMKLNKSGTKSPFTMIVTAQDVGAYKPDLKGFHRIIETMDEEPEVFGDVKGKVLSVAQSLMHDHVPAHQIGLHSVWIDREEQESLLHPKMYPGAKYNWSFKTLGEFADAVEKSIE